MLLALLILSSSCSFGSQLRIRREIKEPIEQIFENQDQDDPESPCRNGGVLSNGRCFCVYPHTGPECIDFQCVHGMSIGPRFAPKSLLFNKPCICSKGWSGDLCEYNVSEKCGNNGEWTNGRCECIGYHFGPHCQFVSKCVNGKSIRGRCACDENWEGDYCNKIICHHGTADLRNKSMSCQCSIRYRGQYCDACALQPYDVSPYPECEKVVKPKINKHIPKDLKKKPVHTASNSSRALVLTAAGIFLVVFIFTMLLISFIYNRSKAEKVRRRNQENQLKERSAILQEAATDKEPEEEELPFARSWGWGSKRMSIRKSSFGNLFRFGTRDPRGTLATSSSTNAFEPARIDTNRISRISS